MKREKLAAVFFAAAMMLGLSASAGAVDGTIEINQATVLAAGGFPYKIGASGSYRLTGNLTLPSGSDGIDVSASYVTIDLNGFSIVGAGGTSAISAQSNALVGTTIENGTVTGFGGFGVAVAQFSVVRNVNAIANGTGIQAGGGSWISCNIS